MRDDNKTEDKPSHASEIIRDFIAIILFISLGISNFIYLFLDEVGFGGWQIFAVLNIFGVMILAALAKERWLFANLVIIFPVIFGVWFEFYSVIFNEEIDKRLYYFIYTILVPGGSSLIGSFIGFMIYKIYRKKFGA